MLIVTGLFTAKEESRTALLDLCNGMCAPSRSEKGCLTYQFWIGPGSGLDFMFFEEWESHEAMDKHFQTPYFFHFMEAFPSLIQGEPIVKRYETQGAQRVALESPVASNR